MNKLSLLWMNIEAKIEVYYIPNFKAFLEFQKFAWNSLIGKLGVMDGRKVESKGGYKYYQMEITKLPVSKTHTY